MNLLEEIRKTNACAFTHGGKFHADDVFSSAFLLYINPEIHITRGNKVPDDFETIVEAWKTKKLPFEEALKRCDMSEPTFYRRLREYRYQQNKKRERR